MKTLTALAASMMFAAAAQSIRAQDQPRTKETSSTRDTIKTAAPAAPTVRRSVTRVPRKDTLRSGQAIPARLRQRDTLKKDTPVIRRNAPPVRKKH